MSKTLNAERGADSQQRIVSLQWQYSRNQRRHTGWTEAAGELFWIESCAPYSEIQGKHGYRLRYADGGHIQHSKFVALLKGIASQKANKLIGRKDFLDIGYWRCNKETGFSELLCSQADFMTENPAGQPPKLLDQMRSVLRVQRYALRTERAYLDWVRRYVKLCSGVAVGGTGERCASE